MKKVFKFVKGRRDDRKEGGITPSSSGDLLSPAQTPEDERFLGLDSPSGYIVDFCGKDKSLTKLHKASWQGNLDKIKTALKKIDIDAVDRHNRTSLHFAVVQGHANIVWFLLGNNARHTICDSDGRTPLLKSVECNQKECIVLLLERGANINHADFSGTTPLHIAVEHGALEMASLLLQKGADVGVGNNNGEHPLHIAIRTQNKDMVQLLLRDGAPVNAVDRENRSPLMLAAKSGNLVMAQLFFEYGAQLFVTDSNGWTAEDYALLGGHQTVAAELKNLMKKEAKPALESHPEEDEAEALKSDVESWNDSNLSEAKGQKTIDVKVGQFLRKLSAQSDKEKSEKEDEIVDSPCSGVVPPPCQPPRSWEIIEAGMIDEATTDGSEPKRRSITALGSLHSRRESFTENHSDSSKYTLSLNRRKDPKKPSTINVKQRFSFNEEESLRSILNDEFSSISASDHEGKNQPVVIKNDKDGLPTKEDSSSDWDSNLNSLLESSSENDQKVNMTRYLKSDVEGTLGRHDTLNEVNEMWISHSHDEFPDPPNLLPSKVDEEEGEVSGSWDNGETFHEGAFPPPPTAFELGVDMAKSMSYIKGISIDQAQGSENNDVVWRKSYEQSRSLDCLDDNETHIGDGQAEGNKQQLGISSQKWKSAELPNRALEVNKRINDQLECYDQALRELAESSYAKKPEAMISNLAQKKIDNYYSLPSSKVKDRDFAFKGKTKACPREYAMSLPLNFRRANLRDTLIDLDGPASLPFSVNDPPKPNDVENNESLGFEDEARAQYPKPRSLNFTPEAPEAENLESPVSDEFTGSDRSDRKSKRHMLLAMRDVKHAVQVTNSFKTSIDEQILSPLAKTDGTFDLSPKNQTITSTEENFYFLGESQGEFGRQETVVERKDFHTKSSPSDSGDEPTLWLQDKPVNESEYLTSLPSEGSIKTAEVLEKSASSAESSPLSNGVRDRRAPSSALRRFQRFGSSSDNEQSVRERTAKIEGDVESADISLSSGPIDPLNKDSGSDADSSNRDATPVKHYSLKKHHKWLKERLQIENQERQKVEEAAAQLAEKAERLQYELEDAKEATKSRDEIIKLLQQQLNRMEASYTKSLEESVHCRLQLTALEQEIFHLKELCSQYEEERDTRGSNRSDSQCALLIAKIKQLEDERENLCREVMRLEQQKTPRGADMLEGGSDVQSRMKERLSHDGENGQLFQNGSLPNSVNNSLQRRNNELESQIFLSNEINKRLEEKLDNILKSNKLPMNGDIHQSILTLSRKNADMEKQLQALIKQLNEKNDPVRNEDEDQSVVDRHNEEKMLLVKTYEKRLTEVNAEAVASLKKENEILSATIDQLRSEINRLMPKPNREEDTLLVSPNANDVENKEVPDSELEILRKKVELLQMSLDRSRNGSATGDEPKAQANRPVREDELAWSNLYGIKRSARKSRIPAASGTVDKDSEEFIEQKVQELERELHKAKGEIIRQRIESDFRMQNILPSMTNSSEMVELKKKVVDLENRSINDDSLRLSLQAKTAEMAIGMKERRQLEYELNSLKMRMQQEFVPKIDAEVAKFEADLLAKKVESSSSARAMEEGLRERLERLAREKERAEALRRRLGRQCVSCEAGVGTPAPAPRPPLLFRSLPRDKLPQPSNLQIHSSSKKSS